MKLGFSVKSVCRSYFGIEAEYVGYVNRDEAVRALGARSAGRSSTSQPRSDAAVYLRRIARKLAEGIGAAEAAAARPRAGSQR